MFCWLLVRLFFAKRVGFSAIISSSTIATEPPRPALSPVASSFAVPFPVNILYNWRHRYQFLKRVWNLVCSCWLWRISRGIWANQKRRNRVNEWIIKIITLFIVMLLLFDLFFLFQPHSLKRTKMDPCIKLPYCLAHQELVKQQQPHLCVKSWDSATLKWMQVIQGTRRHWRSTSPRHLATKPWMVFYLVNSLFTDPLFSLQSPSSTRDEI